MFTNAYVRDYQIQNLVEAKFVQKSCQPIVYSTKVNLSFYKEMHVRLEGNRLLSDLASLYAVWVASVPMHAFAETSHKII